MNRKGMISLLVLLLILIALYAVSVVLRDTWNNGQPPSVIRDNSQNQAPSKIVYEYIPDRKPNDPYDMNDNDGKIVKRDTGTRETTVVVPSLKAIYPKLIPGTDLHHIATSADNTAMYFTTGYIEGSGGIIKFNIDSKNFAELKISGRYDSFAASVSPKSPYAVSVLNPANPADDRSLYVLDFDNDSYKIIDTLPAAQTFNVCGIEGCLGSIGINVDWLSEKEFQIEIYDPVNSKLDPTTGGKKAKLIEKRNYTIQ